MAHRAALLLGLLLAALPVVQAQDAVDADVNVSAGPEESAVGGLSTTVVIILIVLAVLVVALIVAMASRP